jgi:hypothetical protein
LASDNFFNLGGNSLQVIQLIFGAAREELRDRTKIAARVRGSRDGAPLPVWIQHRRAVLSGFIQLAVKLKLLNTGLLMALVVIPGC